VECDGLLINLTRAGVLGQWTYLDVIRVGRDGLP
jgi:hypothetical protein